jgi:hypothetical protein
MTLGRVCFSAKRPANEHGRSPTLPLALHQVRLRFVLASPGGAPDSTDTDQESR